jgi:hypothetical protein
MLVTFTKKMSPALTAAEILVIRSGTQGAVKLNVLRQCANVYQGAKYNAVSSKIAFKGIYKTSMCMLYIHVQKASLELQVRRLTLGHALASEAHLRSGANCL